MAKAAKHDKFYTQFTSDIQKEMQGLEWGKLYEQYHSQSYEQAKVSADVRRIYADLYVKRKRGIFEYLLGGQQDTKLLEVHLFDDSTKHSVYEKQTSAAKAICLHCALGRDANKSRIYTFEEMDAEHVRHGTRAAIVHPRTARCSPLPTIAPKATDNLATLVCCPHWQLATFLTEQYRLFWVIDGPSWLQALDFQEVYSEMQQRGLSARVLRHTHSAFNSALTQAIRWR